MPARRTSSSTILPSALRYPRQSLLVLLAGVLLAGGCGGQKRYPVTGELITQPDGAPVAGVVEFHSLGGAVAYVAEGVSGPDGKFSLETLGLGRGVVPGEYQIIVSPVLPEDLDDVPLKERRLAMEPIDRKYRDYATTPLKVTVKEDGSQNHFRIELERPAHARKRTAR